MPITWATATWAATATSESRPRASINWPGRARAVPIFYVVSPTCTISRDVILTGRHALRNGLLHQLRTDENWHGVGLPHRERLLPQYLHEAGYATACFGKWNIGF